MPRPKSKPQTDPELLRKNLRENRIRQSLEILKNGFVVDSPCEHCRFHNIGCVMDGKNQKCHACTRRGRACERRFHSEVEWQRLKEAEEKISLDIEENENQIEQIYSQLSSFQEKLASAMAKARRLRVQQKLLKERGGNMRDHNQKVLEILESENPPSSEEVAAADAEIIREQSGQHILAATSDFSFEDLLANPQFFQTEELGSFDGMLPAPPGPPLGSQ
ncbi:hypothetical protein EYB25_003448 [Talaromyces marneffei]|nr:hypothetical protein EYB25_003448 [Talaromyces marneffei]